MAARVRVPAAAKAHPRPHRTLLASFAAWKLFLFAIALGSTLVGDAYDTSAALVVEDGPDASTHGQRLLLSGLGSRLVTRLTSWDAIYFVSSARRGYRFEQEWAFLAGLPTVVRALLRGM
jgi:phosphatidylinositol glycan class V